VGWAGTGRAQIVTALEFDSLENPINGKMKKNKTFRAEEI
jgi:hypothetical protein